MLDQLRFLISADNRTDRAFARVRGDLSGVQGALARVSDYANRTGRSMRNIGAGMTAGITAPALLLGRQAVRLYGEQVEAETAVRTALESTGGAAGRTAAELFNVASGLQAMTAFGDEDILRNVTAPLLTFTKIAEDEFEGAQRAILNMSAALGSDLQTTSIQVGRALNDPIAGVTALARAGVQFTDAQKEAIAAMVEGGDVASAQGVILAELETQYGGMAEAMRDTPLGDMQALTNSVGDLKEQLGAEIVPFLTPLVGRVQEAVAWFSSLSPEIKNNIVMFGGLAAAAGPVLMFTGAAVMGLTSITGALRAMGMMLAANPILAIVGAVAASAFLIYQNWEAVSDFFAGVWGRISTGAAEGWAAIKATLDAHSPQWIKDAWDGLGVWFDGVWASVGVGFVMGWASIKGILSGQYSVGALIHDVWAGLPNWFATQWGLVGDAFDAAWQAIKAALVGWPAEMFQIGVDLIQGLTDGIMSSVGGVVEATQSGMQSIIDGARTIAQIRSPSRVFADIGNQLMAGLGVGISDGVAGPMALMTDAMGALTNIGVTGAASLESGLKSMFATVISGAGSATDALGQFLSTLGNQGLTSGIDMLWDAMGFGNLLSPAIAGGPSINIAGMREHGGEGRSGQAYVVGEKRPELFVPGRSGTILPSVGQGDTKRVELIIHAAPGVTVQQM